MTTPSRQGPRTDAHHEEDESRGHQRGRIRLAARLVFLAIVTVISTGATQPVDNLPDDPLKGPSGVTALSGQVVDTQGNGLPGVALSVGTSTVQSDAQGRFLIAYVIPGATVLQIDGRRAGAKHDGDYGYYEARVEPVAGSTTVLPFKSWLPKIDHEHDVTLTSPTKSAVVISTPSIPGLELRIPAGVVIRDADGKVVTKVGITAMPPDRTPVPLPASIKPPSFFTIQPGASCLYDASDGAGTATLVYPNFDKELPKARATIWRYEPDANGWTSFGYGTVSPDGRQVVPDPGVVLTDFDSGECDAGTRLRKPPPTRPDTRQHTGTK